MTLYLLFIDKTKILNVYNVLLMYPINNIENEKEDNEKKNEKEENEKEDNEKDENENENNEIEYQYMKARVLERSVHPIDNNEIIDHILIFTKNIDLCIQLKRFYPLSKLNYSMNWASSNGRYYIRYRATCT
jgi:hypothetical protein